MKCVLSAATMLTFMFTLSIASNATAESYGWSLSGSESDVAMNTGPAIAATPFNVYLWLRCTTQGGLAAAEFSLATGYFNAGFTRDGVVLNAGDDTDLLLAVGGCPTHFFLAGFWTFLDFSGAGGTACLVASPGGVNGTVECDSTDPLVHPNAVIGYSSDGSPPCASGICFPGLSVENSTWGSIKGLYR